MTTSLQDAEQICRVGTAHVPFVEHGEPVSGQAPLFLFGGKDTKASSWKGLPRALGRHVIAVETPKGYLHPYWPTAEGFARIMGQAVLDLTAEWYGPKTRPDIGGWSLGGIFAQAFALQRPDNVGRSVLMATAPGGLTAQLGPFTYENLVAAMVIANPDKSAFDAARVYGGAMRRDPALAAEHADVVHRRIDPIRAWRELCAAAGSWTLYGPTMARSDESRAADTLVVLGGDDPVIPHKAAERLAQRAGMQVFVAEDEGHLLPIDWPGTAGVVNEFLDTGVAAQAA